MKQLILAVAAFAFILMAAPASVYADDYICVDGTRVNEEVAANMNQSEICVGHRGIERRVPAGSITSCEPTGSLLGLPTWYKYLDGESTSTGRCQPVVDLKDPANVGAIGVAILDFMLRLAGILAVAFVIVGGIKYIISQGEPDRAKSARNTIINALIGLAITIIATGIVTFIGNRFGSS